MIITFANGKGGAGKTTLATSIAGEAAHRGQRVLVVDLDVQGNATEHLIGIGDPLRPQGDGGRGIYRTIMDGDPLSPVTARPLIDLLPAGPRTQSLADELNRIVGAPAEQVARSLQGLRTALHDATSTYDLVVVDTPPSEQSHGLLDCTLAFADAVVIPTKTSRDDITGAVKLLQRLANLGRLGTPCATPLGAVLVSVPAGASRVTARAEEDLELITRHIPLFDARIHFRPAPISEAARRHRTLHELLGDLPTARERLRSIGTGTPTTEHLRTDSAAKAVAEVGALYDEICDRYAKEHTS